VTRRTVRYTPAFFDQLDHQLPPERGPDGQPSAHDFLVTDLPRVTHILELAFDDLPSGHPDFPTVRVAIDYGIVVRAFVVSAVESADSHVIEAIGIAIDP
jgi:hypothetical protein